MSGKTKNYTEEFKKQIVQLSKSGKSANSIAKDYGISKSSVTKWVRDFNNSGSFKAKDWIIVNKVDRKIKKAIQIGQEPKGY